ncbi:membrane associated zinc metalloprotease (plasmid) [Legionella adelaidensis]|nr:RIP metalloprotease RseP [Legionella adelaidensis]VEH85784.1 membrane associated zinc metalloprotease [Legionella adelaidensis]
MPLLGTYEPTSIKVKSLTDNRTATLWLPLAKWQIDPQNPDILKSLGITPFIPSIPPFVGEVLKNTPAQKLGLQLNDKILSINNIEVTDWLQLVNYVKANPDTTITLKIYRQGKIQLLKGKTGVVQKDGVAQGFLGVQSQKVNWPPNLLREHREHVWQAANSALAQTISLTGATFKLIGRLITGDLPIQTISGPVGIAQGAGESGRSGLPYYLYFLALVSISLGVLNILPIPMLDGGHLLYYVIEIVRRKPLSEPVKSAGVYLGLVLLFALMVIGFTNDLSRLG